MARLESIMFAGGGTGGHLFPGIALAAEFRSRFPELRVVFVGTRRGLEARVVPPLGYHLVFLTTGGLVGKSLPQRLRVLSRLPKALLQAMIFIARYQPELIVGLGGYASAPVLAAARLAAVPVVIQEQNAFPGVVNRCFSPLAAAVFTAFDEAGRRLYCRRIYNCGNPVRQDFIAAGEPGEGDEASVAAGLTLLVIGGSQGARSLNRVVPEAVVKLRQAGLPVRVVHQAGSRDLERVRQLYEAGEVPATVAEFFSDLASRYRAADLVVCRAGALTLAELALAGRPAIIVPYPHAAHDHQEYNARIFAARGAAVVVRESELEREKLFELLASLGRDGERRRRMGAAARQLARPRAAQEIVDHCLEIVASRMAAGER